MNTLVLQGRRDLNPQPPVLETGALPIEPRPFGANLELILGTPNKLKVCVGKSSV